MLQTAVCGLMVFIGGVLDSSSCGFGNVVRSPGELCIFGELHVGADRGFIRASDARQFSGR